MELRSPEETTALGYTLAKALSPGDVVYLKGPLGAGKSHLSRAIIQAFLGPHTDVPSPTFTLVQIYDQGDLSLWHWDLYRLKSPEETQELGMEEGFSHGISLIEWPERLGGYGVKSPLIIEITPRVQDTCRGISFAYSGSNEALLKFIRAHS